MFLGFYPEGLYGYPMSWNLDMYRVDTKRILTDYAYRSTRTAITQVTNLQQFNIPFGIGSVQSSLMAYADVLLDDFLVIKDFRILIKKSNDLFIGLPFIK